MKFWNLQILYSFIFIGFSLTDVSDTCDQGQSGSFENACSIRLPFQPYFVDNGNYDYYGTNAEHICTRECIAGQKPKKCYYEMVVEMYSTMGGACGACPLVQKDCLKPQCIPANGVEKMVIVVNRQYPAPSIQVCKGDTIIAKVLNKIKGRSVTVHWHGIRQLGTQYMDGVPMVTQCPILEGQTFVYKFLAETGGTFFYHSHSGLQKTEGFSGNLIVRESKKQNPNGHLFDYDLPSHNVFLTDWMNLPSDNKWPGLQSVDVGQSPDTYLIGGHGISVDISDIYTLPTTPIKVFTVKPHKRYVFRIICSFCLSCQGELNFEHHNLVVISTDDRAAAPVTVNRIHMAAGERYDVIVETKEKVGSYWITVRGVDACDDVYQVAVLKYEGSSSDLPSTPPFRDTNTPSYYLNQKNSPCNEESLATGVCVSQMRSRDKTPLRVLRKKPDYRLLFTFGFKFFSAQELFENGKYNNYFSPATGLFLAGTINNRSMTSPPSPLLSQFCDVPRDMTCARKCKGEDFCYCLHITKIKKGAVVEIIIHDSSPPTNLVHPFHLHGHYFHVMKMGHKGPNIADAVKKLSEELDNGVYLHDHLPAKDTIGVPSQGYAVVRVLFDNAGFWLFHCHFSFHFDAGMGKIFWVGELKDLPPVPNGFPRCNNFC